MPLTRVVRSDIKAAKKLRIPWWVGLSIMVGAFLCSFWFDAFGKLQLVLPVFNSIGVLGFAIALKRKLWSRAWFWGCMAVIAGLHVPLVLFVPWTTRWFPAVAIAGIDSLDFCLILVVLAAVGSWLGTSDSK